MDHHIEQAKQTLDRAIASGNASAIRQASEDFQGIYDWRVDIEQTHIRGMRDPKADRFEANRNQRYNEWRQFWSGLSWWSKWCRSMRGHKPWGPMDDWLNKPRSQW